MLERNTSRLDLALRATVSNKTLPPPSETSSYKRARCGATSREQDPAHSQCGDERERSAHVAAQLRRSHDDDGEREHRGCGNERDPAATSKVNDQTTNQHDTSPQYRKGDVSQACEPPRDGW